MARKEWKWKEQRGRKRETVAAEQVNTNASGKADVKGVVRVEGRVDAVQVERRQMARAASFFFLLSVWIFKRDTITPPVYQNSDHTSERSREQMWKHFVSTQTLTCFFL